MPPNNKANCTPNINSPYPREEKPQCAQQVRRQIDQSHRNKNKITTPNRSGYNCQENMPCTHFLLPFIIYSIYTIDEHTRICAKSRSGNTTDRRQIRELSLRALAKQSSDLRHLYKSLTHFTRKEGDEAVDL